MAIYQARGRGRLLDSKTQAMIERRGQELFGLALIAAGGAATLMLASHVPDDPSWMSVTDAAPENAVGRIGALFSSLGFTILGWGSWCVPAAFLVWGLRCLFHRTPDLPWWRAVFVPIWVVMFSAYATSHVPPPGWPHSFGVGGLIGETFLGALLSLLPVSTTVGLKATALVLAVMMVPLGLYVLGFRWAEIKAGFRFMGVGIILSYASIVHLLAAMARFLGRGTVGAVRGAARKRADRADRRMTERAAVPMAAPQIDPEFDEAHWGTTEEPASGRTGLRLRLPGLVKRPADEVEPPVTDLDTAPALLQGEPDDRISSRISDAIKARARASHAAHAMRHEPPVIRATAGMPRGPKPMILAEVEPNGPRVPSAPRLTATRTTQVEPAPQPEAGFVPKPPAPAPSPEERPSDLDDAPLVLEPSTRMQAAPSSVPNAPQVKAVVQQRVKRPATSRQAQAEAEPQLNLGDQATPDYETPPLALLTNPSEVTRHHLSDEALEQNARMLETVLDDYGVKGEIVSVRPGPVVTMYELEPAPGLKASRVIGLADDIARSMSALSARVSTVPGRSVIGIELPNANREMCVLREVLAARDFGDSNMRLPLALGKDIGGDPVVANLAKMPHLLIAGTTGSGKSVAINTMILSLLYKLTPDECRLIMIDPKMLELSVYDGIPHLLSPVVTDPKKAVVALKWVVGEMEERYRKMSKMGVRNIEGYNGRVEDALSRNEMFSRTVQTGFDDETGEPVFETEEFAPEKMPFIVVIVDEMADLMMVAGKEIEACIQRLAQMARASGIHLIMATQRPSVDVITGTIKANFPTRISFQVTSKIDSRTILGEQGAEQLLGMGDMLYMAGGAKITRVHGPFVSDEEVEEIVTYLKGFGPPEYVGGVVDGPSEDKESDIDAVLGLGGNADGEDALYDQAVAIVIKDRKCSTSYIQRKLAIGYNKAARLVEQMEDQGIVTPANHVGKRDILVPEQ